MYSEAYSMSLLRGMEHTFKLKIVNVAYQDGGIPTVAMMMLTHALYGWLPL